MTTDQAKKETIKEAWKALGVTNVSKADFEGWIPKEAFSSEFYGNHYTEVEMMGGYYRPHSLEGFSTNNDWIRIEGKKELPINRNIKYIAYNIETDKLFLQPVGFETIRKQFTAGKITHFQKYSLKKPLY